MFAMDLDDARAKAVELGITPSRENIRRVVRAHDLINREHVQLSLEHGDVKVYHVQSQNTDDVYTVLRNGSLPICNCPDDTRVCKHGIAVLLTERTEDAEPDDFDFWLAADMAHWKITEAQRLCE
jgi:hypothetical protein